MPLKLLFTTILIGLYSYFSHAQVDLFANQFDNQTYIVRWTSGASTLAKDEFLLDYRTEILCEMTFGPREYAWLKLLDPVFPQTLGGIEYTSFEIYINNLGGSSTHPSVEGSSFDYISDDRLDDDPNLSGCIPNFDLTIPHGNSPVNLYILDTGVEMPIHDSNIGDLDFSGSVLCRELNPLTMTYIDPSICMDVNGHGTHGAGIQLSLQNKSTSVFGFPSLINLISYATFDSQGDGNLGAILCALSDIIEDHTIHQVERQVVNCSFSFTRTNNFTPVFDPLFDAFKAMSGYNIYSVMAAGNDGQAILPQVFEVYPARYFSSGLVPLSVSSSTLSVGASLCDYRFADYSNYSRHDVDVVTLGTFPGPDLNSGITYYDGTSQATFATSAVAAMLMSHQPVVDLIELKCSMINGSVYYPDYNNRNVASGILSASTSLLLLNNGCHTSNQNPCPDVNIVTGFIGPNVYKAADQVYSNGFVADDVTFKSGEEITLLPGFSVQNGQFHALIEVCN